MGESDRYQDYKQPRRRFTLGDDSNALMGLFTINVIFFILLLVLRAIYANVQGSSSSFETDALPYFEMPAYLPELARKPWTLLTAMFTHVGFFEMLGNMLWLWAFGYIFQELTGNRKLIPLYIYGGLLGAIVFIVAANLLPASKMAIGSHWLLGAYSANMAVAVAATVLAPDYRFFRNLGGGIPLWVLTLVYVVIDFAGITSRGAAYSLGHLAGAAAGYFFIVAVKKGYEPGEWMVRFYFWLINLFSQGQQKRSDTVREKVFYNTGDRKPFRKTSNVTQQRIDEILDKINQKGYHFLTDEEKNILKRAADEDLK